MISLRTHAAPILVMAALFCHAAAHAAELTIQECIDRAVQRNAGYQAVRDDFAIAREDVTVARAGLLPTLKVRGFATFLDRQGIIKTPADAYAPGLPPGQVESPLDNRTTSGLSGVVEQTLFSGGALYGTYLRARLFEEEFGYTTARQKALLVFEVKRAFYDLLREQIHREALERTVAAKQERLRVTAERHKEGGADREDLLLSDTDATGAELALYRSKNRIEVARTHLANLIEHDDTEPLKARGEQRNAELSASLREVRETAFSLRDDVKTSLKRMERMEQETAISRGEYYPKVTAQGSYTAQRETNIDRPSVWALMFRLDWPIFEWGRTGAQVRKAALAAERARHEHSELLKRVTLEVERTWRDVKDREQEVGYFGKRMQAAEYIARKTAARYRERSVRLAELLQAESEFVAAHHDYIAALYALNISIAGLEVSVTTLRDRWFEPRPIRTAEYSFIGEAKNFPRPKESGKVSPLTGAGQFPVKTPQRDSKEAEASLIADALIAAEARQADQKKSAASHRSSAPVIQQDFPAVSPAVTVEQKMCEQTQDDSSRVKSEESAAGDKSGQVAAAPAGGKTEPSVCAFPQGTAYYLQIVSFRERSNSEKVAATVGKKLTKKYPLLICEQDGWHKLRVTGMKTADEALRVQQRIGIKKTMVVQASRADR